MLNGRKEDILCVRGNCEAEVDQMVLDFPVLAEYAILTEGTRMIFATHGHVLQRIAPSRRCTKGISCCTATLMCRSALEHETYVYLEPRFGVHPQGGQPSRVYDAGKRRVPVERSGGQRKASVCDARLRLQRVLPENQVKKLLFLS
ncbi:MAG: hypothetical protein ACLUSL_10370 [Ruminococcus sp.]